MKFIKNITILAFVLVAFASCDTEDPIESTITEYAELEMAGSDFMYIQIGTPYEEPGVTAMAGEETLEVETSGSVDIDTPGLYTLTYSAYNADGFPVSINRLVVVGDKEVAFNRDLSGTYDTSRGGVNVVTKIGDGKYENSDILVPNEVAVYMIDLGNGELIIPTQSTRFGPVTANPAVNPNTWGTLNSETEFTLGVEIGPNGIFEPTFTKQ